MWQIVGGSCTPTSVDVPSRHANCRPSPCHTTRPGANRILNTAITREKALRQRKAVSLNITTMGICRQCREDLPAHLARGRLPKRAARHQAQDDNGWDVPAKVFRDTPTEAVVVLVDVHSNTSNISYTIYASDGAIQNAGAWFEVGAATVSLRDAKLQSRMNYRVHKDLTTRIRNYDNGRQFLFSTIFIKKAIPDRGAAIVRCDSRPWREDGEVALRVRDRALAAPVDSAPIFMGSHKFDARFSPRSSSARRSSRSGCPGHERTVIFDAWDKADPTSTPSLSWQSPTSTT